MNLGGSSLGDERKAGNIGSYLSRRIKMFLFTEDSPDFSPEFVVLHWIGFPHCLL
jgi:hypothetical protein